MSIKNETQDYYSYCFRYHPEWEGIVVRLINYFRKFSPPTQTLSVKKKEPLSAHQRNAIVLIVLLTVSAICEPSVSMPAIEDGELPDVNKE